jgi:hypothetical protein
MAYNGNDVRGTWTENKIVYAVKNNLEAGMKTTANYNFSLEHLRHEVIAERNAITKQLETQQVLDPKELVQEINCIQLDTKDFGLCKNISTKNPSLHFTVPVYNYLDYLGNPQGDRPFKVYTNDGQIYNKYRDSRLSKRPFVRFRLHEGVMHGFVFNAPTFDFEYISIRAVFENPREVNQYTCCTYNPDETRFPAPDYIVQQIITNITGRWARDMFKFRGYNPPNDQTSLG